MSSLSENNDVAVIVVVAVAVAVVTTEEYGDLFLLLLIQNDAYGVCVSFRDTNVEDMYGNNEAKADTKSTLHIPPPRISRDLIGTIVLFLLVPVSDSGANSRQLINTRLVKFGKSKSISEAMESHPSNLRLVR